MRKVAWGNLRIAPRVLILTASFHEGDFVGPPHHVAPVRLVVFLEILVKLQVLTNAHHNVLRRHAWVGWVPTLVPLALTEVECSYTERNINDRFLFSSLGFYLNACQLGVLVPGHQKDAALCNLFKEVAR